MNNNKMEINEKELEAVSGRGEYIEFVDSDDYEEKNTYEYAYKITIK